MTQDESRPTGSVFVTIAHRPVIVHASAEWLAMVEFDARTVAGSPLNVVTGHGTDGRKVAKVVEAVRQGRQGSTTAVLCTPLGDSALYAIHAYPRKDPTGDPICELRMQKCNSVAFNTAMAEDGSCKLVVVANAPFRIVGVTAEFERQFGFRRELALGRTPSFIQGPETDMLRWLALFDSALKGDTANLVVKAYRKGGAVHSCYMRVRPVLERGSTRYLEMTFCDPAQMEVRGLADRFQSRGRALSNRRPSRNRMLELAELPLIGHSGQAVVVNVPPDANPPPQPGGSVAPQSPLARERSARKHDRVRAGMSLPKSKPRSRSPENRPQKKAPGMKPLLRTLSDPNGSASGARSLHRALVSRHLSNPLPPDSAPVPVVWRSLSNPPEVRLRRTRSLSKPLTPVSPAEQEDRHARQVLSRTVRSYSNPGCGAGKGGRERETEAAFSRTHSNPMSAPKRNDANDPSTNMGSVVRMIAKLEVSRARQRARARSGNGHLLYRYGYRGDGALSLLRSLVFMLLVALHIMSPPKIESGAGNRRASGARSLMEEEDAHDALVASEVARLRIIAGARAKTDQEALRGEAVGQRKLREYNASREDVEPWRFKSRHTSSKVFS